MLLMAAEELGGLKKIDCSLEWFRFNYKCKLVLLVSDYDIFQYVATFKNADLASKTKAQKAGSFHVSFIAFIFQHLLCFCQLSLN